MDGLQNDARLHGHRRAGFIEFLDAIHQFEREYNFIRVSAAALYKTGKPPMRHYRLAGFVAELQDLRNLIGCARPRDGQRLHVFARDPARAAAAHLIAGEETAAAQNRSYSVKKLG